MQCEVYNKLWKMREFGSAEKMSEYQKCLFEVSIIFKLN